jgi:hypothetical protein
LELLADIRCLTSNSQFGAYGVPPKANPDDSEAQDVVDLILCGGVHSIVDGEPNSGDLKYWRERRAAHYERLHKAHEERGNRDDDPFNA